MRLGVVLSTVVLAAVLAAPAGSRTNAPMTVTIVPCKTVTAKSECVGRYSLGVPASAPSVRFLIETFGTGWTKGGTFSLEILDSRTSR
jgi:hypothetical protein